MAFNYTLNKDNSLSVNDIIYGKIKIPYPFSKLVLTKEMLRLNDISQNGFSQYEYEELKNNDRLSHSVGAFYVMTLILERIEYVLKQYDLTISEDDKDIALCSMLLHDIGHGPFSHSLELITNYSHEKRTTDILLGNTEVGKLLIELFGNKKVKKIASFIAEINDNREREKNSFTKLLKSLVSHQLDADRLDYLVRDAYYIGMTSSINLKKIIENMNVVVNNNQEYELLIHRNGLSSIENVLIQRYQMYRDVYLSPISVLGDKLFEGLLYRYRKNEKLKSLPVSPSFKILAENPAVDNLDEFLKMSDTDFKDSFLVLEKNKIDLVVAYLSNPCNIKDYIVIENKVSLNKIKRYLKKIFGNIDLNDTLSIIKIEAKNKLYKKEQGLNIEFTNRIVELSDLTNLIRPQEVLENDYLFFNKTLLRLELGLSKEEFLEKESEVDKMIQELNKKPEEFELKYIVDGSEDDKTLLKQIVSIFGENGFEVISTKEKQNDDEYYDTKDLDLYSKGGSLRIRESLTFNKLPEGGRVKVSDLVKKETIKLKGTYKMPLEKGEVYSSRSEIEETLEDATFSSFEIKMKEKNIPVDFSKIIKKPILKSLTRRTDIILEKNGVKVSLSLDNSMYVNHFLDVSAFDRMIEIEAIGKVTDRVILNDIHDFINEGIKTLSLNKQSKYERGINSTISVYQKLINNSYNSDISVLTKKLTNI